MYCAAMWAGGLKLEQEGLLLPRDLKMVFPQVLREIMKNRECRRWLKWGNTQAETRPNFTQLDNDI